VLVQTFENFPDVLPFSFFTIEILPYIPPAQNKNALPYFEPSLPTVIQLEQCKN